MADINNLKPIQKLKPFTRFCMTIGNLPSSYLESMTYYEQILWFIKFLEDTVIPTINNNSEAVEELQQNVVNFENSMIQRQDAYELNITTLYNQLKSYVDNYFDNLDVQEEINNKLDDMVEAGTLQEIITSYLNSKALFCFDNVQDMKEATNLIDGSFTKTYGFYNINDGGESLYKIRTKTENDIIDNMEILSLYDNNLVAQFIPNLVINVKQMGAKGDGETDDTIPIQKAFSFDLPVIFPKSTSDYLISSKINVTSSVEMENYIKMSNPNGTLDTIVFDISNINNKPIKIINPLIDGGWDGETIIEQYSHGIRINNSSNITIKGGIIKNCMGDNILITGGLTSSDNPSKNINVDGCILDNPYRCCIALVAGENCNFKNLICKKYYHYVAMIDIEPNQRFLLSIN